MVGVCRKTEQPGWGFVLKVSFFLTQLICVKKLLSDRSDGTSMLQRRDRSSNEPFHSNQTKTMNKTSRAKNRRLFLKVKKPMSRILGRYPRLSARALRPNQL